MPENNELEISFKKHYEQLDCSNVMKVPFNMRCDFVMTTTDCQHFGYANYMNFLECGSGRISRFQETLACVGLAIIFIYYISCLAIVADQFYSPALKAMAKKLHLSEHLAGVTLLAFGNSTSDILGNIQNSPIGIIFTYMMSNAILITLISGGLVCLLWPTQLPKYETVRTLLFFLLGTMTAEYFYYTQDYFSMLECVGMIFIYIIYLCIEIIEGYFERAANSAMVILDTRFRPTATRETVYRRVTISSIGSTDRKERTTINTNVTRLVDYRVTNPKNEDLFEGFVQAIQPIDPDYWRNSGYTIRIALIMLSPLMFIFLLLIPMVNLGRRRHGWSKLLNCAHIVITPMFMSIAIMLYKITPLIFYQLCITVPLAIIAFKNSRTDIPPSYHFGFVILGTLGCITVQYVCTTEMEEILQVCGMILGLSRDFISATISCWGASICTIVINVILAQHGYAAMAIAASYAGPFFSFIMAIGCLPLYRHIMNTYVTSHCSYYPVAYIFLMISLSSSLIWCLLFNFYGRRSVGIFNIMIYILYNIYCVLCEMEIIHSYAEETVIDIV
ncbi:mitochondrial sodium/calcium exchanger protein-like [Drosophila innubila]|uniref:mitochondrial sodium/calcium exchanger protein-like n=1 Tax=Drosophila innubila TaxID=198719 RepID=UPI00148CBECF|nr:mitochondrial sodium/calcium exchanger protein-like [Drosophila innubila]